MSEESTTCRSCGKGLLPTDAFCSGCGIPVRPRAFDAAEERRTLLRDAVPTGQRRHCRSCNAPLFPGDAFCASCGVTIAAATESGPLQDSGTQLRMRIEEASQGRYEVLREIGRGGMGVVLLAEDRDLRRKVAIKVLNGGTTDPATLERFEREARTVAQLRHEAIVRVHAVGGVGDLHYFVMDYVAGVSLQRILASRGRLPIPMVEAILFRVGIGLAYAHGQPRPVIHRDIKPSNIIIDTDGQATLMDFGVAKVGDDSAGLTRTGMIVGTPEYMSPEQVRSLPVSPATDQYALGAVTFAMLTGRPPFSGPFYEVLIAHQRQEAPDLAGIRPDCPPALAAAVARMLAKEPEARWPDLPTLLRELELRPLSPFDPVVREMADLAGSLGGGDLGPESLDSRVTPVPDPSTGRLRIAVPRDELEVGDSMSLEVDVEFPDGQVTSPGRLAWSADPPGIVRLDSETGELVAVGPGSTRLTAQGAGVGGSLDLTVKAPEVVQVTIRPERLRLAVGETTRLSASTLSRTGTPLDHPRTWASSDPGVVRVSSGGEVEAVKAGSASVVLYCDSGWAAVAVQVEEKAAAPVVTPPPPPPPPVETAGAIREAEGADRSAAPGREPRGKDRRGVITRPRHARGEPSGGLGLKVGIGVVSLAAVLGTVAWFAFRPGGSGAGAAGGSGPAEWDVFTAAGEAVGESMVMEVGERLDLAVAPSAADPPPEWSSSAPSIVAVDGGSLAALAPGRAEIRVAYAGVTGGIQIDVRAPWSSLDLRSAEGATVRGEPLVLAAGSTRQVQGVLLDDEGTAVDGPPASWSSSDEAIASVNGGLVQARRPGTAVLTARVGALEASVQVRVDAPPAAAQAPARQPETRAADPTPTPPVTPMASDRSATEARPAGRGTLVIVVTPGWANAFLDDEPIGEYRTQYEIELDAGTYRVRLENPAFAPADTTLTIRPGAVTRWARRLGSGSIR